MLLVLETTGAIGLIANAAQIYDTVTGQVPPGGRSGNSARREEAYLRFQQAATDSSTMAVSLPTLLLAAPSPLLQVFWTPTLVREMAEFRRVSSTFAASLNEIRLVGNPGPRALAEEVTALVGELFSRVPTGRGRKKIAQEAAFDACLRTLGDAHRRFTLAARQDLHGSARWWRRHAPKRWRRSDTDWPGGWPGPDALHLIKVFEGEGRPQT